MTVSDRTAGAGPVTRICIFADPHYCTKDVLVVDRRPSLSVHKIKRMVRDAMNEHVSLFVCLGDFINIDDSHEQDVINAETAAAVLKESGIPCVCCMGNHDCEAFTAEEFAEITGFLTAPCVYDLPSGKRLVFLNANYDSSFRKYRKDAVDWTDANIPPHELSWLREVLTGREAEVFIHQDLEPEAETHHRVRNADEVLAVLKANDVRRVWQGHYHYGADSRYCDIEITTLKAMCVFEDTAVIAEA